MTSTSAMTALRVLTLQSSGHSALRATLGKVRVIKQKEINVLG